MIKKVYLASLAVIATLLVILISCSKADPENPNPTPSSIAVQSVSLSKSSAQMKEGESLTLTATVSPSNATEKGVFWSSSNATVATVTGGTVKALKAGSTTITVTTKDGGKTASCSITVTESKVAVTSITLDKETVELTEGATLKLTATILPENATNKNIAWTSSAATVATVDATGLVTAIAPGESIITAKTEDGGKTATCKVIVTAQQHPVEGVSLDKTSAELVEGETITLVAIVTPDNASNKNLSWSTSDASVASVENGLVTAVAPGSAVITVTTEDGGKTATCNIQVKAKEYPVEGVSLDKTSAELVEGDKMTLTATIAPANASNKNVNWSSSNASVATVDNGVITAVAPGSAVITVTTEDGGKTASCAVTVKARVYPVTGVTLDKSSAELVVEETLMLTATIIPDNATNKNIIWSTSNFAVATVQNGKVTAVSPGTAVITVTTEDGNKTATCSITVKAKAYPVTGVTLDKTSAELTEGDKITLRATVAPENASNKNVSWSSNNTSVATVNNGEVTAVAPGTATITVTTEDGGKTATCVVTVKARVYPVTGVSLDKTSANLVEGESITLTATITPENATNKNVNWSSSNTAVATVQDGKVLAIAPGVATIIVTTEDGGKTATCNVVVKAKTYPVTGVTLDKTSAELTEGDKITLKATVSPENASNKNVTWSSNNTSVATVNNGEVTTVSPGTATITVTTEDGGKTATCVVTVKARVYPVTGVSLDKTNANLVEGESITLTATITPENATNKNVNWSSSNTAVATVQNGKVLAVSPGVATITVTTEDGGKTATCNVVVKAKTYPVTGVTLDKTSAELTEGDKITLRATVSPENASNKNVTWSSNNTSVATVNNGEVTAVAPGTATITVTTEDGGKTATCVVTVKAKVYPVTGVTLDKTSAELTEGDKITLKATVSPENASNKNVSWSSSNASVATVNNGEVTAVAPGTATITVITEDGGKTATCVVTVKARVYPVTGVTLDKTSAELTEGDKITLKATVAPENATNKNVTWTSSNPAVATVQNGVVTAVKAGSAIITVKTVDGGKTATCTIKVKSKVGVDVGDWGDGGNNEGVAS